MLLFADGLMTQDGGMHVQQTSEAVLNQDTDQWSIQLTCGLFNFRDSPPFYVEWTVRSVCPIALFVFIFVRIERFKKKSSSHLEN